MPCGRRKRDISTWPTVVPKRSRLAFDGLPNAEATRIGTPSCYAEALCASQLERNRHWTHARNGPFIIQCRASFLRCLWSLRLALGSLETVAKKSHFRWNDNWHCQLSPPRVHPFYDWGICKTRRLNGLGLGHPVAMRRLCGHHSWNGIGIGCTLGTVPLQSNAVT